MTTANAQSHPNIAFIKYWGNRDPELRIPSNGSISMNLGGLHTRTRVTFDPGLRSDRFSLNGHTVHGPAFDRVCMHLERVRKLADIPYFAEVVSENNFPAGAGIASSASAFAALSLAAATAAGLQLDERALSRLARLGSGSACRSIPGGFVEWQAGQDDADSYAYSIAPASHWELADCIAILSREHKVTGSSEGHTLADTSPLQAARIQQVDRHLEHCRKAILERDFEALAEIAELDSNLMHAVIMTSSPSLLYWEPGTLAVMKAVQLWRRSGMPTFSTIDAGANVHVLCPSDYAEQVAGMLESIPGVQEVLRAHTGGPAYLLRD